MTKKDAKPEVIEVIEKPAMVPVSQTHRVTTVEGSLLTAYETDLKRRQDDLKSVEDDILQDAMEVLSGSLRFADVAFDAEVAPADLVKKLVEDGKDPDKVFRIMKAAQMKSSEAPAGLMIAQKTVMGILKARASDKAAPKHLNVVIQAVTTLPEFKRIEEK
jgi:hypothetical protein